MSQKNFIDTVDGILTHAKQKGIIQHNTEDTKLLKNFLTVEGKKLVNFGSCSYLGLEFEDAIREGAKSAIDNYGTQFSSSRAYVSPVYYKSLEDKLSIIFDAPTIVTPTTTLGHIAAIPTVITSDDAVILDHQVHNSVQTAVNLLKAKKTHVELIRHNRMDLLEKRILELKSKHRKIWYMADGIYSMYGDMAPLDKIYELLDKYEELNFYVDDAHGMSCFGNKGQGYVLSERKIHNRMIVATSFAKAFATGGGALIFPNEKMASLVRNCGGPLITSGPMQPSALGAANVVADLHLSGEIERYQSDLNENIKYTDLLLSKFGLPNLAEKKSPIFFIAVSLPKIAYKIIDRLKSDGYFLNLGIFPAVPIKNTGVRFTITRLHTFEQIHDMVTAFAKHFKEVLAEEDVEINQIYKAFKMSDQIEKVAKNKVNSLIRHSRLNTQFEQCITKINKAEWDKLFASRGTFDHNSLEILQTTFREHEEPEQNWDFDYVIVRDPNQKVILATFLTTSIIKDDMFSDPEVSIEVEERRKKDRYYMTSKSLSIGSPLTEGDHLYLDSKSAFWKEAMDILLQKISSIQERKEIEITLLRDLSSDDEQMDSYMLDNGFFKMSMPENCKIQNVTWTNSEEFFQTLSKNNKRHFRKNITRNEQYFDYVKHETPSNELIEECYKLYLNVKN
jgi:7-keto-8-aminopelargonate synthetase-like enzyme